MHVHRTEARPPGGTSPPGAGEPPEGFDLLLALHHEEARTAIAEGQQEKPEGGEGDALPEAGAPATDASVPAALVAAPATRAMPVGGSAGAPAGSAAPATVPTQAASAVAPGLEEDSAAATPTGETPAAAPARERPAGAAAPASPAVPATPVAKPATPAAPPAPTANAPGAPPAPGADASDAPAGEQPGPSPELAEPAPAPVPMPVHPRAERTHQALRLADAALRLQDMADVAFSRGAAHARLQLHPAELGGIEVRLRVTAEGLTASITADRPEAAQALQQAGAELRRALEQRGLTVLSVDVALAGAAGGHEAGQHAQAGADRSQSGGGRTDPNGGQEAAADAMEAEPTAPRSVPAGALVDVLA